MKHHIAILFHESDRAVVNHYAISGLADVWRNDGPTIVYGGYARLSRRCKISLQKNK